MDRRRITQSQRDFIRNYLAEEAHKGIISQELIDDYREAHKDRLRWGRGKLSIRDIHPHGNNPFCNICNIKIQPGDYVYYFHVRAILIYHVDCFDDDTGEKKQLSICYQDRAYRKRLEAKREMDDSEKFEKWALEKRRSGISIG